VRRVLVRLGASAGQERDQATERGPGGDKRSEEYQTIHDIIMNDTQAEQGTTRQYALRRLRRERPELLERVLAAMAFDKF